MTGAEAVAPVANEPAAAPAANDGPPADNSLLWALGGGALLLAGLGGAAMMRRRRPVESDDYAMAATPAAIREPEFVEPAMTPVVAAPVTPRVSTSAVATGDYDQRLAAMIAEKPCAENPFLTHAKRMRRARVLLAERAEQKAPIADRVASVDAQPAPVVDRSQTIYRFGNERAPSGFLKPRTR